MHPFFLKKHGMNKLEFLTYFKIMFTFYLRISSKIQYKNKALTQFYSEPYQKKKASHKIPLLNGYLSNSCIFSAQSHYFLQPKNIQIKATMTKL